jgi:hypothetical protein
MTDESLQVPVVLPSIEGPMASDRDLFRPYSDASWKRDWMSKHSIFCIMLRHYKMNATKRYFSVVLCAHKLYFMDVITGSLYCPATGLCQSSALLSLDLPTLYAITKEEQKQLLTFKPTLYKGETTAEAA